MSNTPVWDKPRPKGLGKSHKLSAKQKASAKARAKAAGRPWPNLVDNMRAARAFGGMAYEQQNQMQGMGNPPNSPTSPQQSGQINYNPNNIPPVMPSPSLPPPQPVQAPVGAPPVMSDNVPRTMAKGGAVEDALRLAKTSPILNNHTGDRLPMRPYGPRFNPQSGELDSRDLKDIGYYGPIRDPEGYSVTEYSGNRGNFTYPTVHKGMSKEDLAATLMHEHLNKPKYEGDDIISEHLNEAQRKIPFPADVDQRAYEAAQNRVAEGHSPYFEQGKDEYPAWSPEQHWEEPAQYADGGGVEDALEHTHGPHAVPLHQSIARHGYATDGGVEGKVEFEPEPSRPSDEASQQKFYEENLKGSAPQYDPTYDQRMAPIGRAAMNAAKYTQLGGMANAAGMMDEPSMLQNIRQGNYGNAALQAAAVAIPSASAARQGPRALYELSKLDKSVLMPGYSAYKTAEDWVPNLIGEEAYNEAKNVGNKAIKYARNAVGYGEGGIVRDANGRIIPDYKLTQTPNSITEQPTTPESTSGKMTTPNRKTQISPQEYQKGQTKKNEYVMAQGGVVEDALRLAKRNHARSGGVKQVSPNMNYSDAMRTYYDLIAQGKSPQTAAGLVGNFLVESPNKAGTNLVYGQTEWNKKPGQGGAGIAQWTGPRREAFQNFAKERGMDWRSPQANTAFLEHEAKTNPWVGKQLEKVENEPTVEGAAKVAATDYLRPKASALQNSLGARIGYAQNVANIAEQGNPFGGTALAQQSERANMFAKQQQPEAQVQQANLPKPEEAASPADQTSAAHAQAATTTPQTPSFTPKEQEPVKAPDETSTQNFLQKEMAPEPQQQPEPQQAQAPEVPETPQPEAPEAPQAQASDDNKPFTYNFDEAAYGGTIKNHKSIQDGLRVANKYAKGGGAWTRKEGQNAAGGLNAKGRASLKAQGHDIKPPQPEGGSRRDSFCARMKGMKKKLTSKETANDPNSRINKSLRVWNC